MSKTGTHPDELRRRLFRELARGEEAELGPILAELEVLVEPPAHLDAEILAAVPDPAGAREPPARLDRAILAASEAAVAEKRGVVIALRPRRKLVVATAGALALAAGLALVFGLRGPGEQPTASDEPRTAGEAIRLAAARFSREVSANRGEAAAARVREAESGLHTPGWDDPPAPGVTRSSDWAPAEAARFAEGLIAFTDRLWSEGQQDLGPQLEEMLARERKRCPEVSRCHGLLSLRLGELALASNRPDRAGRYASDAARADDEDLRARAKALAVKAAAAAGPR